VKGKRSPARDGVLALDKKAGLTSQDAVSLAIKATSCGRAGHSGTLDKFASGVLVLLCGRYTRLARFFMQGPKRYRAEIAFGTGTDTLDPEGRPIATGPIPDRSALEAVIPSFIGTIAQVPPEYSAIHINGQRAYTLALNGQKLELAPRPVRIDSIRLLDFSEGRALLEVDCGPGTYIRALARDLAVSLGTVAYLASLRRSLSGGFDETESQALENLGPGSLLPFDAAMAGRIGMGQALAEGRAREEFLSGKLLHPSSFREIIDGRDGFYAVFGPEGSLLGIARDLRGKPAYEVVLGGSAV